MKPLWLLAPMLCVSPLAAQQEPTRWDLREDLRIGSLEGPAAMTRVPDITTSADGMYLYVLESAERTVRMFDARTGEFLRRVGRGGDGPGEFRSPVKLGWRADTLYVVDAGLPRLSLFTVEGEVVRTLTYRSTVVSQTGLGAVAFGYLASGELMALPLVASHHVRGGQLDGIPWFVLDEEGRIRRSVGYRSFEGAGRTIEFDPGSRSFEVSLPMSDRYFIGIEPDGESVILLTQPAGGDPGGHFRMVRLASDGDTIYARRYRYTPRPVSTAIRDSIRSANVDKYAAVLPLTRERVRAVIERDLTIPEYHPPFTVDRSWLTVTRDGAVWIRREELGKATAEWLAIGPDGEVIGAAMAPARLRILHVDGEIVWGVITDAYDVPYVTRSRLDPRD